MFEKKERISLAVYLHYNRDARKVGKFGELLYHSKRMRYVIIYVPSEMADDIMSQLKKERFVKKVVPSHFKEIDQDFVGSLWRNQKEEVVL